METQRPDASVVWNGRDRVDSGPSPTHSRALSDGELIGRIAERDREAFEALYRRFARPVLGFALRRLADRARAEDAVQETFAAIWRSAASYRPERGAGAPWLYAVARNAIVNEARKRAEPTSEAQDYPSAEPGPREQAEAEWVRWRVHRALEVLPERQRTVIELSYWGELSQSEIATRLNIPLGTGKTRTRAALARLAGVLEHEGLQEPVERRASLVIERRA
jgi:RNA polymerase sigma-70 factor, ECF subfamily